MLKGSQVSTWAGNSLYHSQRSKPKRDNRSKVCMGSTVAKGSQPEPSENTRSQKHQG